MTFLTDAQREQLLSNGSEANRGKDHFPVVKLFTPDAGAAWLLTELDPDEPTTAFGLCDLGLGFPELGYVSIAALAEVKGPLGLPIECDLHFAANYPVSVYARAARVEQGITFEENVLERAKGEALASGAKRCGPQP